ncbi:MAG: hypothetical protein NZ772_09675 [Cyanobacteria bacterium]|nr:hypothetical protein [Cyanobacteriota bacterium]MDW8200689.1 hypothetical protein [Cyanobacteriota bacterium SKYGB_h_bin112]
MQALRRSLWMVLRAAPRELRNLPLMDLVTGSDPSVSLLLSTVLLSTVAIDETTFSVPLPKGA